MTWIAKVFRHAKWALQWLPDRIRTRGNGRYSTWDEGIAARGRIAVYTCLVGAYDSLAEPPCRPENVDYIAFTDQELPEGSLWEKRPIPPLPELAGLSDQRRSRYVKILPHRVLPEYEYSVWVDGNLQILGDVSEYIHCVGRLPIALGWHPYRSDLGQELKACIRLGKDDPELMRRQVAFYRSQGMPRFFGLTENNFIVRRHGDPACARIMEDWWREYCRWSARDQLSLTYVIWKNGYSMRDLGFFPRPNRRNPDLRYVHHSRRG